MLTTKKKRKKKVASNKVGLVGNFVLFLPPFPSFCSFLRQNVIGLARVPWFWGLNSRLMSSEIYGQESISWYSSVITELPHSWAMGVWSEWDKSIWIDLDLIWYFVASIIIADYLIYLGSKILSSPLQESLTPYFINVLSASLPEKHCPPFWREKMIKLLSSAASAHFMSALVLFL